MQSLNNENLIQNYPLNLELKPSKRLLKKKKRKIIDTWKP